jgi:lipid-A-disaccharide synthase
MRKAPTILVSCGEASGDLHAARLVEKLLQRFPGAKILAFGGDKVAAAGAEVLYNISEYAIIGVSGIVTKLPKLVRLERGLKRALDGGVDLFVPVDYPGLNLRLAGHAKKKGIPVLYYISPQVWAWGAGRVRRLAASVDRMAVILPFEEAFFRRHGIAAEFVGHPLVEDHALPGALPQDRRSGVGLLPGSRTSEVRRILPVLLAAAAEIRRAYPGTEFSIGRSEFVPREIYEKIVRRQGLGVEIGGRTRDIMAKSRLLLVASGTATLEGALFETPLVIVYRMSKLNYFIADRLIKIDNIGLVNIILDERISPEFVQTEADPKAIADAATALLGDEGLRAAAVERFKRLRTILTGSGGCRRVAEICGDLLGYS